ncbi:MAG: sulfatase-like hydrolase/transferase [Ardenticatenales bacterium]|nr:sulfatase-like hydrolase/transferase [Ardenticatenales bacterium]
MIATRRLVGFGFGTVVLALAVSGAAALPVAHAHGGRTAALASRETTRWATTSTTMTSTTTSSSAAPTDAPPNIVLILADDLDTDLGTMARDYTPNIHRLIADQGATLADYYVTDSLCCPSRTTYLRGQYTHNHGVYTNGGATGGYERMVPLGLESSTLATWLQAAGYRTALIGKYINGYPLEGDDTHVPAGWSEWFSPSAGNPYGSYNYTLNENGTLVRYGRTPADHITDVLADKADAFLAAAPAPAEAPFFAFITPYAPHAPADPAPRHAALLPDLQAPRGGSYDEADVSDKPAALAARPPLTSRQMTAGDEIYRKRVLSMMAVDEMVARLIATLEASGQLANTYVIFTSDNGFHIGQHRLPQGKQTAYEEDIHVPFYIRGPGITPGTVVENVLAGNVDIAPTLAELGGAAVPDFVDGRSLAPYLNGTPGDIAAAGPWRQAFLVEQYPFENERGVEATAVADRDGDARHDRGGLLEPPDGDESPDGRNGVPSHRPSILPLPQTWGRGSGGEGLGPDGEGLGPAPPAGLLAPSTTSADPPTATYIALRTARHTYIEHSTGERELYDNVADPNQLDNLPDSDEGAWQPALSMHLRQLHTCAGATCRAIEAYAGIVTNAPPTATPPTQPTASTPTRRLLWLPIAHAGAEPTSPFAGARETALVPVPPLPTRTPDTTRPSPTATRWPTATVVPRTATPPPATQTSLPLTSAACPQTAAYNAAADGVSLYVTRDGIPVCADYPNGGSPAASHALASGTKSFSGVMAAAAIEDGILTGWDEVVADTITEWQGDPRKSKITVRHLLSLTSGLDAGAVGNVPTYAEAIAAPATSDPGTTFAYGPVPYQAFGEFMRRKLQGRYADPLAYLDARILEPIGARYDIWRRGTDGMPRLPSGAQFTAAEWSTFGDLIRQHGRWDGRQLVREDLLAECFIGSDVRPTYGLTWWLLTDLDRPAPGRAARVVAAKGAGIQRLYVLDEYGIVAVRQTGSQVDTSAGEARFGDAAFLGRLLADMGITP